MEKQNYKEKIKHWKKSYIFSNGLKLWYRQTDTLTSRFYSIFDAGSKHDGEKLGLAHFTEHLLFDGNSEMTGEELKIFAAERGLKINAGTGKGFMLVSVEDIMPEYVADALTIIDQTTVKADFNGENFDREKNVVLSELADANDSSYYVAMTQCNGLVLDAPYKYPILGFKETVADLTKDDVIQFHANHFLPESTIICYTGDLPSKDVLDLITKQFGKWQTDTDKALSYKEELFFQDDELESVINDTSLDVLFKHEIEKSSQNQVVVMVGYPGVAITDEDKIALDLACEIFGAMPMVNRMFKKLRVEQGLCYWASAGSICFQDTKGRLNLSGSTSATQYKQFVASLLELVEETKTSNLFSEEELKMAKLTISSRLANFFDCFNASQSLFIFEWLLKGDTSIFDEAQAVEAVDLKTVQTAFNKYFSVEPVIITVGAIAKTDEEKLGVRPEGEQSADPNKVSPSYIAKPINAKNKRVDDINDNLAERSEVVEDDQEQPTDSITVDDNELNNIALIESSCSVCGKAFKHLKTVKVTKCPACKVAEIQGNGQGDVERVAVYNMSDTELEQLKLKGSSGAKSKGKSYGAKAGSKFKSAHRPQVAKSAGKGKGDETGDSAGSAKAGGKQKFKPTGKGANDKTDEAAQEAEEKKLDQEAELEQRGAEAADGKGSAFHPEDHPRNDASGKFING